MALLTGLRSCLLAAGAVAAAAHLAAAQPAGRVAEDSVKAVFLFNFSKYVSWPATAVGDRSPSAIRICVPAEDDFFARLRAVVQDEDIDGKPLQPIALGGLDDAKECHILFVGDANSLDGKAWLSAVRGRQVLTVGDGPLNDDTVIAFIRDQNRIRFDINRAAATSRGINVSAKLLRLARRVKDR
jgi:hypothetical protein